MQRDILERFLISLMPFMMFSLVALLSSPCLADDFLSAELTPEEVLNRIDGNTAPLIVDLRAPVEFGIAHIPGATNIPLPELENRLEELRGDKGVLIYCLNGSRTRDAEPILYGNDIRNVYHLDGSFEGWIRGKYPFEKGGVKKTGW